MKNKQQFWKKHIAVWKGSGLSQAEYCRKHDIPVKTFGYHKRRLAVADKQQPVIPVPQVVESIESKSRINTPLKLFLPGGLQIEITPGFCQQTLKRVLEVVT